MRAGTADVNASRADGFVRVRFLLAALVLAAAMAGYVAHAANEVFTYDNAGRLITVDHGDGRMTSYTLDPAGNRTSLQTTSLAEPPGSITVPSASTTGSYSVSWTASGSAGVTAYRLWEANNPAFTGETLIHTGASPFAITGRGNGSYYYRVQACEGTVCGPHRTGGNPVVVTLPPGAPASINAPATNTTGAYSVSWTAPASGLVTSYEVQEATSASFTSPTTIYSGAGTSTSVSGRLTATTYYYRVRACNGSACGGYTASGGTAVTLPPPTPGSISNPSGDADGSYDVSWATVSGPVTAYELWEATNSGFTGQTRVYNSAGSTASLTGRANGTYYYRVRACNAAGCGGYRQATGPTTVALPPGTPASISVPPNSTTGSYTVSWGTASGTVTAYELYEATNSGFTGQTLVYTGTATASSLSGRGNGAYYYRVRACNGGSCSGYQTGGATTVTLPPGTPASISVPPNSTTGSYTVSWGTASGTLTAYELYESTSSNFSTQTQVYSGTGTSAALSGRGNGTYYYRVRACNGSACGGYQTGSSTTVTLPPGTPASITLPSTSSTGSFSVSWGTASGTLTAYELYESTSASFGTQTLLYSGTGTGASVSSRPSGTYYYRVRACNGSSCSSYRTGAAGVVVTLPPSSPTSIAVPSSSTGTYTISWGTATGTVTAYELYESSSATFSTQTQVYGGTGTSQSLSKGNGSYYYRVRACNASGCSGYQTGANAVVVTVPAGVPASISVPASSTTGSYTVSWGTASGTVTSYELYEATNSGFTGQSLVYTGTANASSLSGRANGTYYYRVRACTGSTCSGYRTGGNATTVTLPPGVPASISVPSSSTTGAYTISWGTASGTLTAYELYESTSSSFSTQTQVYSGTGTSAALSGRGNGTYYYRVRACNGSACGGYRTGGNATTVSLPPGAPASITLPSSSTTGSFSISWGTSSGTITAYELYESTSSSFTTQTLLYSGTGTGASISSRPSGTYYYRVRACNGAACGGYRTGTAGVVVTLPPGTPASISVPSSSTTGNFTISWGVASGTVTAYELYESTSSGFGTQSLVYSGTSTSAGLSGRGNGTYYYRVRACNSSPCSGYRTGGNAMTVTLPPGTPASISVPTSSSSGSYSINWGAATGALTAYELYESTSSSFGTQSLVYSGTGTGASVSGRSDGVTYYYRVRACYSGACSGYATGSNGTYVLFVPTQPAWISVPTSAVAGSNYTVSWPASSGIGITYELYESTDPSFPGAVPISTTGTSVTRSKPTAGTWLYRVRACNAAGCSSYMGNGSISITVPSPIQISDRTVSTHLSGFVSTAKYQLASSGDIMTTMSNSTFLTDVGDWISPKSGMSGYQVRRISGGCNGPASTWVPLSSNIEWSITIGSPQTSGSCSMTIEISAVSNPSVILDSAFITLQASRQ